MENHKCSKICKAIGLPAYGGSWFSIFKLQEGKARPETVRRSHTSGI